MDNRRTNEEYRRSKHERRREESEAKRAEEDSISRDESISPKPRIPIPARADPARSIISVVSVVHVITRLVHVGFRQIRRAQTTPAIKVSLFKLILIEFPGLQLARGIEIQLMSAPNCHLSIVIEGHGFAFEHSHLVLVGVKVIQTGFDELHSSAVFPDPEVV